SRAALVVRSLTLNASETATPATQTISPPDSTTGRSPRTDRGTFRSTNRSWRDLVPASPSGLMRSPSAHRRTVSVGASSSASSPAPQHQPAQRGRMPCQPRDLDRRRAAARAGLPDGLVDRLLEHLVLVAQERRGRQHVSVGGGMNLAEARKDVQPQAVSRQRAV